MAADESRPTSSVPSRLPPPPRKLYVDWFVEARAKELESLHAIISDRLAGDFTIRRGKRRRTTSHAVSQGRRRKRPVIGESGGASEDSGVVGEKKLCRRARRRKEFQKNPDSGFSTTSDGTKRLRTHLWHAKRFTMVKRWGFYLPLGLSGKGRGSRAVMRWLKSGALLHDFSYCSPIQLEGPEDSIMEVLKMVLRPTLSDDALRASPAFFGVGYEIAMLYHNGTHFPQFIAPIMYMWRPLSLVNDRAGVCLDGASVNNPGGTESKPIDRQLWVWLHASAYEEGFEVITGACEKKLRENGILVSCFALDHIGRLDLMGSQAIQVIRRIMLPARSNAEESQESSVLDHAEKLPPRAVLSFNVHDPRTLPYRSTKNTGQTPLELENQDKEMCDTEKLAPVVADDIEEGGVSVSDNKSIWDLKSEFRPPIQEHIFCTEKRNRRLKFFCLERLKNGIHVSKEEGKSARCCPVLLVKHGTEAQNLSLGWSIIIPMSWVRVFWTRLISLGVHAIGSRERRWIACNNELPCFPYDFPDCKAYSLFMAGEAAASEKSTARRPPAYRPPCVPAVPPWDCLVSSLKRGDAISQITQKLSGGDELPPPDLLEDFDAEKQTTLPEQSVACFNGFVPRTCSDLKICSVQNSSGSFPLFPEPLNDSIGLNKPILVRVVLRAQKKGAFEEGAIVCMPSETDLSNWESRSEEGFHIPTSCVELYFRKGISGNSELRLPPPLSPSTYRWPIGFVTSGFVYGSSKPVAMALCGAEALDFMKQQQQQVGLRDVSPPSILVLVRNLKSSTYRRATATLILDHKEDLEFM